MDIMLSSLFVNSQKSLDMHHVYHFRNVHNIYDDTGPCINV